MALASPSLYMETTIISYLAAFPSRDLIVAAHQQITHDWWNSRRERYNVYVSALVAQEAAGGDPQASARRLQLLQGLPRLEILEESRTLAENLVRARLVPARSENDALHIAIAAVHGIRYLLTWNCTHMANADIRRNVEVFLRREGYQPPILCTPEEMPKE